MEIGLIASVVGLFSITVVALCVAAAFIKDDTPTIRYFRDKPRRSSIIYYKNYKGVTNLRYIVKDSLWYGTSPFHKEPQKFLRAYDLEKGDYRDFAVKDIIWIIDGSGIHA